MREVSIVGLDLAKRVFPVHAVGSDGGVVLRRKPSRGHVITFFRELPKCTVAMEACATAHYWAREIGKLVHEVRLIPPAYVKPFVKRQKNDAADAEAIVEAATRPSMRFVVPKSECQQACSMLFRTRDLFVRQRTQLINALRAHLAEHGVIAPQGIANLALLTEIIEDHEAGLDLVVETGRLYLGQIEALSSRISSLEKALRSEAKRSQSTVRLMSMPGMGPITAMAAEAFAPTMGTFRRGRDASPNFADGFAIPRRRAQVRLKGFRSRGRPDDEFARKGNGLSFALASDHFHNEIDHLAARLLVGREAERGCRAEFVVVEADDGDVLRYPKTELATDRLHRANRQDVVLAHQDIDSVFRGGVLQIFTG